MRGWLDTLYGWVDESRHPCKVNHELSENQPLFAYAKSHSSSDELVKGFTNLDAFD